MGNELYYPKGLEVWKSPVGTKVDGGTSFSLGFHVCTATAVVGEEGAAAVAALLCLGEKAQKIQPTTQPEPVAWLRHGEKVPIQGCPFGAMWISDKDDPRAFPVYAQHPLPPSQLVTLTKPVGYATKNDLANLRCGASCIDLFGEVVPTGFEMVPLYAHPPADQAVPPSTSTVEDYRAVLSEARDYIRLLVGDQYSVVIRNIETVLSSPPPTDHVELPIELDGVSRAIENEDGFWKSCSGCHELDEGVPTGTYSNVLKCHLGIGCSECGGIGAIWDDTDYSNFGVEPDPVDLSELPDDVRQAAVVAFNTAADVSQWGSGEPYLIIGRAIMAGRQPPSVDVELSPAATDVLAERRRQVEVEDFDASHDDMATKGQLATAAACYAFQAGARGRMFPGDPEPIGIWPWDRAWWKPTGDHRRNLIKAGALIIAEIERLDREEAKANA